MYTEFYRLTEKPFNITPDSKFLYWSSKHQDAFRHLTYSMQSNKGIILLTGEIGTGKTVILHAVMEFFKQLDKKTRIAFIVNSTVNVNDLFRLIFNNFGLEAKAHRKSDYLIELRDFLIRCSHNNERTFLILDEAQNFSTNLLEEIRLLSNIETPKEKLIQVILAGQPSLTERLNSSNLLQLKQRIGISCNLLALNQVETESYIQRRLDIAGAKDNLIFSVEAIKEIYHYSKGIPRVINTLCDNALLLGFAARKSPIDREIIKHVAKSMDLNRAEPQDGTYGFRRSQEKGPEKEYRPDSVVIKQARDYVKNDSDAEPGNTNKSKRRNRDASLRIQRRSSKQRFIRLAAVVILIVVVLGGILVEREVLWKKGKGAISALATFSRHAIISFKDKASDDQGHTQHPPNESSETIELNKEPLQQVTPVKEVTGNNSIDRQDAERVITPVITEYPVPKEEKEIVGPFREIVAQARGEKKALDGTGSAAVKRAMHIKKVVAVEEGDTLAKILLREYGEYNATILALVQESNPGITDINLIRVGQSILLPGR